MPSPSQQFETKTYADQTIPAAPQRDPSGPRAERTEANKEPSEYVDTFISFSDACESLMRKMLYALIAGLIVSQCLLQLDEVRRWLVPVDRLEGVTVEPQR